MKQMVFPLNGTKVKGVSQPFDLTDPVERVKYFEAKAGEEIKKLKMYMDKNTFVGFLLGKKQAGKGTYSKMFEEIVGAKRFQLISVGDLVREANLELVDKNKKKELLMDFEKKYRGVMPAKEALDWLVNRTVSKLGPTDLILFLVERAIKRVGRKSVFIDGFPRDADQVALSLYLRHVINYRDDPDFMVIISIPEAVINERIKYRRICPKCQTSRNLKLLVTSDVRYDPAKRDYYLWCDNPECERGRMAAKESDDLGIEPIRDRLNLDQKVMETAYGLHGVEKVMLRNAIPAEFADRQFDKYELTPEFYFELDKGGKVLVKTRPWVIKDDEGVESYSLMPAPVVLSMVKQLVGVLGL